MVVSSNNEACAHRIEKNCRPMFNGILERVMEPFHHLEQEMKVCTFLRQVPACKKFNYIKKAKNINDSRFPFILFILWRWLCSQTLFGNWAFWMLSFWRWAIFRLWRTVAFFLPMGTLLTCHDWRRRWKDGGQRLIIWLPVFRNIWGSPITINH